MPKSGFPATLWVSVNARRRHGVARQPKHEGFGRIRLGARLDIRRIGQKGRQRLQTAKRVGRSDLRAFYHTGWTARPFEVLTAAASTELLWRRQAYALRS